MNGAKIILDLCGGTGAWSRPYADAGYDVRLVTLPEGDVRTYEPPENVHGILAAPPCTMFSLARTNAKKPRDFGEGMETVEACLSIIWRCRTKGGLKFWALENPRGYLRQFLGKPPFQFRHYQFGDYGTKPTDIWGYFAFPKVTHPDAKTTPGKNNGESDWYNQIGVNAERRAITPPGFSQAFFKANP